MARIHGMPMVGHCYHRMCLAPGLSAAYVATCDNEIAEYVRSVGGEAVMTAHSHTRAMTRTAEAMHHIEAATGTTADVIVMVQGDEPLIPPDAIAEALKPFADPTVDIVNIMSRLTTYERFVDRNNVKVVVNHINDALYFSREPIPSPWRGIDGVPMYQQTGIIAFRRDVLVRLNQTPETRLEQIESVDLNRALETGGRIRMVPIETVTLGVDTPAELEAAGELMATDAVASQYLNR